MTTFWVLIPNDYLYLLACTSINTRGRHRQLKTITRNQWILLSMSFFLLSSLPVNFSLTDLSFTSFTRHPKLFGKAIKNDPIGAKTLACPGFIFRKMSIFFLKNEFNDVQ